MNNFSDIATSGFIAIIFILLPFIILIVSYKFLKKSKEEEKKCTCSVKGIVSHVDVTVNEMPRDVGESSRSVKIYQPRVTYTVNGKSYTGTSRRGNSKLIEVGEEVIVHYNPNDPDSFYIEGYKINYNTFIFIPLGFIVLGIVMFILSL